MGRPSWDSGDQFFRRNAPGEYIPDVHRKNYSDLQYGGGSNEDIIQGREDDNFNTTGAGHVYRTPQAQAEVDRYRQLGDQAGNRDAYQLDWFDADEERRRGLGARGIQNDATNIWKNMAVGGNAASWNQGQQAITRGVQNQQALAGSTRGGPLAQMVAQRRAAEGEAAFRQQGTQNLLANRAREMAMGRQGYADAAGAMRTQDQESQNLAQDQANMQAQSEIAQRGLNSKGRMGFEQLGFDTNKQQMDSNTQIRKINEERNSADQAAQQQRDQQIVGAGVSAGKAAFGLSDKRAKTPVPNWLQSYMGDRPVKPTTPGQLRAGRTFGEGQLATLKAGLDAEPSVGNVDRDKADEQRDVDFIKRPVPTDQDRARQARRDKAQEDVDVDFIRSGKSNLYDADNRIQEYREPEYGLGGQKYGAPKGYAASRLGQPGSPGGPEATYDLGFGAGPKGGGRTGWDAENDMGAGTYDVLKYGTPSKRSESKMDDFSKAVMKSGMISKRPASVGDLEADRLKRAGEAMLGQTEAQRQTLSDAGAKREAFIDGMNHGEAMRDAAERGEAAPMPPGYMPKGESPARARDRGESIEAKSNRENPPLAPRLDAYDLARKPGEIPTRRMQTFERIKPEPAVASATMLSPKAAKTPAKLPEDDEEDRRAAEFMKAPPGTITFKKEDNSGESEEDRRVRMSQEAFAKKESDRLEREANEREAQAEKRKVLAPAIAYADAKDDEAAQKAEDLKRVPWVGDWARNKVLERRGQTDEQKAARGLEGKQGENKLLAVSKRVDNWAKSMLPDAVVTRLAQAPVSIGYRPEHDVRQPGTVRQPTSFMRERPDENVASAVPSDKKTKEQCMYSDEDTKTSKSRGRFVDLVAEGNRHMEGYPYTYKDGYGEDTDKVHFGPNADDLEKSPVTRTALRYGPGGLKMLDKDDIDRLTMSGIGSLQHQQDALKKEVEMLRRRRA